MSKEGHLYVFQCWKALLKYFEQQKKTRSDSSSGVKFKYQSKPPLTFFKFWIWWNIQPEFKVFSYYKLR